jgi:hypothetical protein
MSSEADLARSRALAALYTGAVADILDELGLREQCLPTDIRPLSDDMKVAGPVYTVRGRSRARPTTAAILATARWTCWGRSFPAPSW